MSLASSSCTHFVVASMILALVSLTPLPTLSFLEANKPSHAATLRLAKHTLRDCGDKLANAGLHVVWK